MATEPDFLRAVLAGPDADGPRLTYAAWCDSQPDPGLKARAEFIRWQLKAHQSRQPQSEPALQAAKWLEVHRDPWLGELKGLASNVEYYRGFAERVTVAAKNWRDLSARIRRLAPVRHLDLTDVRGYFPDVIKSEAMRGVRSLMIRNQGLRDADLEALAESPFLEELRWLNITGNQATENGAAALAQSKSLPALKWVNFFGNPFEPNERYSHDQGQVVESWMPEEAIALELRFGRLEWLRHPAAHLWDTEPNRFTI